MSLTDSDSRRRSGVHGGSSRPPRDSGISRSRIEHSGQIYLNGDVLACACPDCGAPMAIRLWLRAADCWRCGVSIELTEEQEQYARKLLEVRQSQMSLAVSREDVAPPTPDPEPQPSPAALNQPPVGLPVLPKPKPQPWSNPVARQFAAPPGRVAAALKPGRVRADFERRQNEGALRFTLRRTFGDLPAWLVSVIFHMLMIILLGLWVVSLEKKPPQLVLAVEMSNGLRKAGDARVVETPTVGVQFDKPHTKELEPKVEIAAKTLSKGVPREIKVDDKSAELLDKLNDSIPLPLPTGGQGDLLAGRDPRVRSQLAIREGGTSESEAAVARGLVWLARHQSEDGRWRLDEFHTAGECNGECSAHGVHSDTAGTALGLLPFLGAGQTHQRGDYLFVVAKGLRALMDLQKPDGDLRGRGNGNMYAHGQAAIALCEAYALSKDSMLRDPAQKAIDYIVKAQHRGGGWRYSPGEPGDTSVVGWQLMALRSAGMAGLDVPTETFSRATKFLNTVQVERSRGLFSYMPGGGRASAAMTAEGLLSRQYAGVRKTDSVLVGGIEWLLENHAPDKRQPNMYYWYYATQVMHHAGGKVWEEWNSQIRDTLIELQEVKGHEAGSWSPRDHHDRRGGRVYMTALAVCTLEVYYRHLPLYRGAAVTAEKK